MDENFWYSNVVDINEKINDYLKKYVFTDKHYNIGYYPKKIKKCEDKVEYQCIDKFFGSFPYFKINDEIPKCQNCNKNMLFFFQLTDPSKIYGTVQCFICVEKSCNKIKNPENGKLFFIREIDYDEPSQVINMNNDKTILIKEWKERKNLIQKDDFYDTFLNDFCKDNSEMKTFIIPSIKKKFLKKLEKGKFDKYLIKSNIVRTDNEFYVKFHGTPASRDNNIFPYFGLQITEDSNIFDETIFKNFDVLRFYKSIDGKQIYDYETDESNNGKNGYWTLSRDKYIFC